MESNIQGAGHTASSQNELSCLGKRPCSNEEPSSGHRQLSDVWKFYRKEKLGDKSRAFCIFCNRDLSATKNHGTSHLWSHYATCPKRDQAVTSPPSKKSKFKEHNFDQNVSRRELAKAIIMHEYPLCIVEHIGFRAFVSSLEPRFRIVSRGTIKSDILKIYHYEKNKTYELLNSNISRVALTTDMWTCGNQKKGFMAITAHFIDDSWTLQSRVLSFIYVPCPHTAEALTDVLHECLLEWKLDKKLSGLTVDNCSTNDSMINMLLGKLATSSLILKGSFLHMRCCAHILNLIVKEGLDVIKDGIERIRDSVSFWASTPKRVEIFQGVAQHLEIAHSKKLSLDCATRWNSTYVMLVVALQYKDVFPLLTYKDKNYKSLPLEEDWAFAKDMCGRLKLFNTVTKLFSGNRYPTSNVYFPQVCEIKLALTRWEFCGQPVIETMASRMVEKFDKYWLNINGILAIAAILDPRYKLKLLQYYFPQMYYGHMVEVEIEKIRALFYELFNEYKGVGVEQSESSSSMIDVNAMDDPLAKFDAFVQEENCFSKRSELDSYLDEKVLPRSQEFDILAWWSSHGKVKYPILHRIARDIFAIPISTVASESAFSTSGRLIGPHRSRLHSKTVEALMCAQNWLLAGLKESDTKHGRDSIFVDSDADDGDKESCTSTC